MNFTFKDNTDKKCTWIIIIENNITCIDTYVISMRHIMQIPPPKKKNDFFYLFTTFKTICGVFNNYFIDFTVSNYLL